MCTNMEWHDNFWEVIQKNANVRNKTNQNYMKICQ